MAALTNITTANFHTYPEIITKIYITAPTLRQRGIQVILHWVQINIFKITVKAFWGRKLNLTIIIIIFSLFDNPRPVYGV